MYPHLIEYWPDKASLERIEASAEFMKSKGYTWNGEKWEKAA